MPEAITKYAINSTLGTEEFRPLDKIIIGQKALVGSDTTLKVLSNGVSLSDEQTITLGEIIPKMNGVLRLKATANIDNYYSGAITIYINENAILTFSSQNVETKFADFNVQKGETYTFKIYADIYGGGSPRLSSAMICGMVADVNEIFE